MARGLAYTFSGKHTEQIDAWQKQISILRTVAEALIKATSEALTWVVALEYPIYRLQRRIDAVLVTTDAILVFEFKTETRRFEAADRQQVEDYALDLSEFHAASHGKTIIPILVATHAPDSSERLALGVRGKVWPVAYSNARHLPVATPRLVQAVPAEPTPLQPQAWIASPYKPTPTILEAARSLYAGHDVREITYASADVHNLASTSEAIGEAIALARTKGRLAVCFVTGTPGSGKTLAGLNVVHDKSVSAEDAHAAYLSGNRPLVEVLREALARDDKNRAERTLKQARHEVRAQVQPLMGYLEDYVTRLPDEPPVENVVIFDEAQRAWDAAFGEKRFQRADSEPALFLEIMARRRDWAVIVALVGGGQEINKGEGGLAEWGRALAAWAAKNPHRTWDVSLSHVGLGATGPLSKLWAAGRPAGIVVRNDPRLHLLGSARSHRFVDLHKWVDALLDGDLVTTRSIANDATDFPVHLTRSLADMRDWLRSQTRGERRCGLLASSGAKRLRAYGLGVSMRSSDLSDIVQWYLQPAGDIRSSYALEVTASEYTCQGLELDLIGLCWGGDLLWNPASTRWDGFNLSGTKWQTIRKADQFAYLLNKYRVLLTRARQEMVIWVPPGDADDPTRDPQVLDATAESLTSAGARPL